MTPRKPICFTKEGYEDAQKELAQLQESRKEAVKEVSRAAELGDRSENAAYKVGKQKLRSIDSRLKHLNRIIRDAEIVEPTQSDSVSIGSVVTVTDGTNTFTYTIVGDYEADSMQKKISPNSPIGKALMGKKIGDEVTFYTPNGITRYKITEISS